MDFHGEFDELKSALKRLGYEGDWSDTQNGKRFRATDGAIVTWYPSTGRLLCQGKPAVSSKLEGLLAAELSTPTSTRLSSATPVKAVREPNAGNRKIFVVHGHDSVSREQLELVLHKLGLDPFVLANSGGGGLTIIEALETEIGPQPGKARFGIVLLTPDDMGYSKKDGKSKEEPRARQNVVLEMGMLIAAIGRQNVAILKKGHLEVPSDAQGILYLPFNDHVKEIVPKLVDRLRASGFTLSAEAITKASS